jgi:hypothetical protein
VDQPKGWLIRREFLCEVKAEYADVLRRADTIFIDDGTTPDDTKRLLRLSQPRRYQI